MRRKMLLSPTPGMFFFNNTAHFSHSSQQTNRMGFCVYIFHQSKTSSQCSGSIQAIKSSFLGKAPAPSCDRQLDRLIMGGLSPGVTNESSRTRMKDTGAFTERLHKQSNHLPVRMEVVHACMNKRLCAQSGVNCAMFRFVPLKVKETMMRMITATIGPT